MLFLQYLGDCLVAPPPAFNHSLQVLSILIIKTSNKQFNLEKVFQHHIQWLLHATCSSQPIITCYVQLNNVTEGYIHANNANMCGAVQSLYTSLPG